MVARLLIDKPNLVQLELRPVKPDVEAHCLGTVVGRRNRQPIGLDAAVCARDVTAYHVTGFLRPRRPAGLELFRAREAATCRAGWTSRTRRTSHPCTPAPLAPPAPVAPSQSN